jgi:hypothetical protein
VTGYLNKTERIIKKNYETTRLPVAAYLICNQLLAFAAVRKATDATAVFEFLDPDGRGEGLDTDFEQGRTIVDARSFASSERFLKNKIYQALRSEAK